ncbi:MAG: hypothetical protein RhofKO_21820 [Rhodothermales bacterium]
MRVFDARGQAADILSSESHWWRVQLEGGPQLTLDSSLLISTESGYRLDVAFADLVAQSGAEIVVPVVEEVLAVDTQSVETGRVKVHVATQTYDETVEVEVQHEAVHVERVRIDKAVDARAEPRTEDDRTIIPVYREEWVLQKQLVLAEEVHVWKEQTQEAVRESVTLHRDVVQVERIPTGIKNTPVPSD